MSFFEPALGRHYRDELSGRQLAFKVRRHFRAQTFARSRLRTGLPVIQ